MSLILLYLVSGIQFCLYRKIHSSTIYEFYFPWFVHPRPVVTLSGIWYFCILHLTFSLFLQEWGLLLRSLVLMYLVSCIIFLCLWYCSLYPLLTYVDIVQSWYPVSGVCFVFYWYHSLLIFGSINFLLGLFIPSQWSPY